MNIAHYDQLLRHFDCQSRLNAKVGSGNYRNGGVFISIAYDLSGRRIVKFKAPGDSAAISLYATSILNEADIALALKIFHGRSNTKRGTPGFDAGSASHLGLASGTDPGLRPLPQLGCFLEEFTCTAAVRL